MKIPNFLDPTVPIGKDDSENVEITKYGDPHHFVVRGGGTVNPDPGNGQSEKENINIRARVCAAI